MTTIVVISAVILFVVSIGRVPWPMLVYAGLILALALGTSGYESNKVREFLPAFVLLFPLAKLLSRQRPLAMACSVAFLALGGLWFSAYSLTVWRYGI